MRSKSLAERPEREKQAVACIHVARTLHAPATLSLVGKTEARPAGKMKPGLY